MCSGRQPVKQLAQFSHGFPFMGIVVLLAYYAGSSTKAEEHAKKNIQHGSAGIGVCEGGGDASCPTTGNDTQT